MISPDEFLGLFDDFQHSAVRLESRSNSDIVAERDELRAFLAGDLPVAYPWSETDWTRMVARQTAAGHELERVRVMDDPLTDYNRYMIYTSRWNARAGESIRFLARAEANALDLPDHDFWVFDSARVVELRFTHDGRLLGHDLIDDSPVVAQHEAWIRRGLAAATPRDDYLAHDPTRAWPPIRLRTAKGT